MHNDIHAFRLLGEMSDTNIEQTKQELIHSLKDHMRLENHVQVLDLDPQFTWRYDEGKKKFDFCLTIYGVELEDDNCAGVMDGKAIMKYIPPTK